MLKIDPLEDPRWDDFVGQHDRSCFFHRSEWAKIIKRTYGFTPYYLVNENMNGKITSGWPFFWVNNIMVPDRFICLPFTDYCWPLFSFPQDSENIRDVLSLMHLKSKNASIEVRGGEGFPGMVEQKYYKRFAIDLTQGIGEVWRHTSEKSIRYSIKKAERERIIIIRGETEREMKRFYRLNVLTRRHHGVIPQPYRFFQHLIEEIIMNNRGFLLLAEKDGLVTAGSIFLIHKDTIYHKYNATHPRYKYLCSTHLILWHAIMWALQHGFKAMDLGRTAPDNNGLMSFKRHWGAIETDSPYYYHPEPRGINAGGENSTKYRSIKKIINRTPTFALSGLGSGFYRFLA